MLAYLWRFLHLLFAFSFVGATTLAEWNTRAARATSDWNRRAALWGVVRLTTRVLGLGALVLLGILGNLLAVTLRLPMGGTWMRAVNGLWLATVLVYLLVALPAAGRLVAISEAATGTTGAPGPSGTKPAADPARDYASALGRWRLAAVALGIFYLVLLALMVLRPLVR